VWFGGHAPVELADAGSVWLASDRFLAGNRDSGSEQDPLRRLPRPARRLHALAAPSEGVGGAHCPGGTRAVPRILARSLRIVRLVARPASGMKEREFE